MPLNHGICWKWVFAAAALSEVAILAIFFLLLLAAKLAGVPEIAKPMSTLDYADALVSSFGIVLLFALWVGKRIESALVLHGALIGVVATLLFTGMWIATTPSWVQPVPYLVAHALKVVGGVCGGILAKQRKQGRIAAS
jgi:hypothetical protein